MTAVRERRPSCRGRPFLTSRACRPGGVTAKAGSRPDRGLDLRGQLAEPLVERLPRVHRDLELPGGRPPDTPGGGRRERDHQGLAVDAHRVGDGEDRLDLLQRDDLEHRLSAGAAQLDLRAGPARRRLAAPRASPDSSARRAAAVRTAAARPELQADSTRSPPAALLSSRHATAGGAGLDRPRHGAAERRRRAPTLRRPPPLQPAGPGRLDPRVRVLWAHAGMTAGPVEVGAMLDRYPTLWVELALRTDVAPEGALDTGWRALFLRYPDHFCVGTDTWTASRWAELPQYLAGVRAWLAELPPDVARRIAFTNAARLYGVEYRRRG